MNSMQSVRNNHLKAQPPIVVETVPNNVKRINFKSDNQDSFVRKSNLPNNMINPQQAQMMRMMEAQQKEQKKQKLKQNLSWGVGIAAGLAIIGSVIFQLRMARGGVGGFNLSNLEFKDFAKDDTIFDLRTSKSLHTKVKTFFIDLLDGSQVSEEIAKRAGTVGEAGTNSVLLLGGSGVGKTEVIKAYAKAANADYVAIKVSDFANSYVNGTSKNISEMFNALIKRAKENPNKQLVISLDEVDALVKVTTHDTSGEISKNRQSLLTGLDALLEQKNIKLFTSSNANVKDLDGAFLRRCGYNFEVPMPDKEQLLEALKFQLRKCEGAFENNGKFFDNNTELDKFLDTLIERKCAFGDVKNIVKAAKNKYELAMHRENNPRLEFKVKYLKDVLDNIETTAGEKAAKEGSII